MKYVIQPFGGVSEFDEKSPEYLALMALPAAQRPKFLAAGAEELTTYLTGLSAAVDGANQAAALRTEAVAAIQKITGLSAAHMKALFGEQLGENHDPKDQQTPSRLRQVRLR